MRRWARWVIGDDAIVVTGKAHLRDSPAAAFVAAAGVVASTHHIVEIAAPRVQRLAALSRSGVGS